jgi:hypothetical protein
MMMMMMMMMMLMLMMLMMMWLLLTINAVVDYIDRLYMHEPQPQLAMLHHVNDGLLQSNKKTAAACLSVPGFYG